MQVMPGQVQIQIKGQVQLQAEIIVGERGGGEESTMKQGRKTDTRQEQKHIPHPPYGKLVADKQNRDLIRPT